MNEGFDETMKNRARITPDAQDTYVPGQVIGGKFKVISRLGSGGMGTVYRVEQIFLQKEFALKTMDNRTGSDVMIQRFQLEAKAAFSLSHPNLVKVHDYGILDNGNPYLVMDFIDGITFAEYLKDNGPLPIQSVAPLFVQACFGLMAAHEHSVVHRDIKPANLMLLNNVDIEAEGSVKLVDFGIAKLVNREDGEIQALTRTGEIFGSPLYMSPEQCSSGTVDHRSDIYSLGCVLFEMLTGTPPHMGQNALKTMLLHQAGEIPTLKEASLGRDFPEPLERIVAKMLRKYPEQRYQNIGLVAHDLTVFGSENRSTPKLKPPRITQKSEVAPPQVVSMTSTRLYTLLALTGLLAAVLAGSSVYFVNHNQTITSSEVQTISKAPSADNVEETTKSGDINSAIDAGTQKNVVETKATGTRLEQLPAIKETDVVKDHKKQHLYVFPDFKLGEVCSYTFRKFGELYQEAKGPVYVPVDTPVGFKINGPEALPMFETPSIFKKIPGKDFKSLILSYPMDTKSAFSMNDEQSPKLLEQQITAALQNLDDWTNLKSLHIKNCILNADALNALNKFEKLRLVIFETSVLDPDILVKQPFLLKLTDFNLTKCNFDQEPIVKQLCSSSNLQAICIDKVISMDNLRGLQSCPRLTTIQIATGQIDDETISEICKLHKLKRVRLFSMTLSDKQIKMLTHCSWLKEIDLSLTKYGHGMEIERVRALDPRIRFTDQGTAW
jgi:serine/threonine protein kinase